MVVSVSVKKKGKPIVWHDVTVPEPVPLGPFDYADAGMFAIRKVRRFTKKEDGEIYGVIGDPHPPIER